MGRRLRLGTAIVGGAAWDGGVARVFPVTLATVWAVTQFVFTTPGAVGVEVAVWYDLCE